MTEREKKAATVALYLRAPADLVEALDEWVEEARATTPGASGITRTDLIRDLLQKAVTERREARKGKTRR